MRTEIVEDEMGDGKPERDARPYHERRAEMAFCPECLSPDCFSLVCDEEPE